MDIQYQKILSLTFKQLIYTLATVDEGSVSAAARKLHVSQPAISAAIAALERHYGLELFTRHPAQGVSMTQFGVKVMAEVRLLCDQAQTVAELASPGAGVSGEIRLCCYEAVAPHVLPRVLKELNEHLPDVTVRYKEADFGEVAEGLQRGTTDLAISYDLGMGSSVLTETLYSSRPRVICSSGHKFARRRQLRLAELQGERIVLLDQPLSAQYFLGMLRANGVEPIVSAQVRGIELQRSLVANGFGIAVIHTLPDVNAAYDGKPIHVVEITDDLPEQRVLLAYLAQNQNRPVLRAARQVINDSLASN